MKRKIILSVLMMLCIAMCVPGCKKKKNYLGDTRTNTMTINSDGSINEIACQDFAGVTYDISNLENTIKDEITAYKQKYNETDDNASVKLLQYEEKDGFVRIAMEYSSLDSYNKFNNTSYKNEQATNLPMDMVVKDLGGNDRVLNEVVQSGFKAISIDGDYTLTVNGSVLYYNAHATIGSDGCTVVTDGLDTAVIIYQ